MGSQQWGKLDINQYNVHILSSVSVCFTLSVWLLERQNFNLDNAQYLEFWEKIFWKGISNISLCVVREGEINFKLSTSSFISDFTDNAAAQGGAPDITSTWKCLSTNFKLISPFKDVARKDIIYQIPGEFYTWTNCWVGDFVWELVCKSQMVNEGGEPRVTLKIFLFVYL